MKIANNINLVPFCEWASENFSIIEMSRRLVMNNININIRADLYTITFLGFGLRFFVDQSIKVEDNKPIINKDMQIPISTKGEKTGEGIITLETYKKDNEYTTYARHEFKNLNVEGTISELKKLIKKLEKEV